MENNDGAMEDPVQEDGFEDSNQNQPYQIGPIKFASRRENKAKHDEELTPTRMAAIAIFAILFLIGAVYGFLHPSKRKDEGNGNVSVNTVGEFPLKFLKQENNEKNLIYSPLSIKYGLSLLSEGADGETKEEINGALDDVELTKYKDVEDKLSLANAIFVRDSFRDYVLDSYKASVVDKYNSEILFDSFADSSILNKWVDNKTFGLIKEVGLDIDDDTQMVLSNALAIQMDWAYGFNGDSSGRSFYLADGSTMRATTLSYDETKNKSVGYYADDNVTMAMIDLEQMDDGTQLEFVAVMPNKKELKEYIETVDINDVIGKEKKKTLASDTTDGVDLFIPKFSFDYELNFKEDLKVLGIKNAFEKTEADFSKMVNLAKIKQDLGADEAYFYVSDAVHKANIDFSQKGIKASAVTAFAMKSEVTAVGPVKNPVKVVIDHPFMFLIMDKSTQEIWFVGAVYEPEKWESSSSDWGI